jgi:hypothetical protein
MDMAVGDTRTPIHITAMATIPTMRTLMVLIGEAPGGGIGGAGTSRPGENDHGQDEIEKLAR